MQRYSTNMLSFCLMTQITELILILCCTFLNNMHARAPTHRHISGSEYFILYIEQHFFNHVHLLIFEDENL